MAEEFEASQKEAAEQQVFIRQEVERGHEQVVNQLKTSHQTNLQGAERKFSDEPAKLRKSHLQEVERLEEEHGVALSGLKVTSLASQTRGREDLEAETE